VARAHVAAVERGRTGENYLLAGPGTSYRELVRIIGETIGREVPARVIPGGVLTAMARANVWLYPLTRRKPRLTPETAALASGGFVGRSDKAIRELGYREVELRAMVADSYAWMKKEGRLSA
jgi:nucleoside-diphosphate-sugar epimerase